MKSLKDLANILEQKAKDIDKKVMESQEKTALQVYADVVEYAPKGKTKNYVNSIKVDETKNDGDKITTFIGSSLLVGPSIWGNYEGIGNNPAGSYYNLGYLLEHGTMQHAIPNAFDYGFYYGYTDNKGVFHKGTLDKDWHPGSRAIPHYALALQKNKKLYKDNLKVVWR